ncbi:phage tail protein [Streptomyces eurythermus]
MAEDDVDYGRATITIDINAGSADADGRAAGIRIQRALLNATRRIGEQMRRQIQRGLNAAAVTVHVEPDLSRFDAQLLTGLRSLDSINVPVAPDVTGFVERLRALLADVEIPIRIVPDLDDLDARIRAHNAPDVTVGVDVDANRLTRALAGLGGVAGRVGGALTGLLRIGAFGIAAAGAAQGVGVLLAALAPAAGIIAAYPAAIAGAQVALGTLKLALVGVQDALSAALTGDAEEFLKAIEGLSPAAQKAVTAVRNLSPRLKELQQNVQQSFFRQFSGDIEGAVKNLLPLGSGLDKIAANFGKAASEGLKFAASQQAAGQLRQIIQGTADATSGLSKVVTPLAKGFLDVAAAVSKAFGSQLGAGIGQVGAQVGTFLSGFAASGRAVEAVRKALEVFRQLGTIASNVGHTLAGVWNAANVSGGGLLNNIIAITGSFREFVASARGQEAIANIFGTVSKIAAQLGPILGALVAQLGAIAPALGPLFESLGPAIVNLVNSLGPALAQIAQALATVGSALADGLAALGPALGPLGGALASVVTALAPILPLAGSLANTVASLLAPALEFVAVALQPVISALAGALMPILPSLTQAFVGLLQALLPLGAAVGQVLGQAVAALAPLLSQLAGVVAQVVVAITPLVAQIVAALLPALPPLVAAFQAVINALLPLLPPVLGLVQALVPLAATVVSLAGPLLQVAAAIAGWTVINAVVPLISGIVSALGGLIRVVTAVVTVVSSFAQAVVAGFRWLYNTLVGHSIIPDLINGIVGWFRRLPGMAASALGALVSAILGPIRSAASSALARARSFVSEAASTIRGLPGKAKAALGNLGSTLVSAGRDLVQGLINGVKAMAGNIASAAKSVVSGAVSAAKSVLKIGSPSKVFAAIGKDTGRGFIIGLTGTAAQIKATTERLAKQITDAFRGKSTRVDDRLVAMLQAGNKRLTALAAQRDKLVQRLADAQKFAADTSKAALDAFSLQNLTQGEEAVTTRGLQTGLQDAIDKVRRFTSQINNLAKRGLRKDLLQQIIGLGPAAGAEIATVLSKSTRDNLKRLNSLQAQLAKATGALGTTSADVLFDAGKQAGAGFLAGLKAQRKSIEKLMLDIAKSMQTAIRHALRIKSPSVVMRKLGEMTGLGLRIGLVSQIAALETASGRAARALVRGVSSQLSGLDGAAPALGGNVVPLTRAQRLRASGAEPAALVGRGRGGDVVHHHTWNIREVGNAQATATRVLNRFVLAAGVG